jgi:hypothetical protein
MPAAPAGQAGWPQHGQFEVLMNSPKNEAQGNKKRNISPDSRLKAKMVDVSSRHYAVAWGVSCPRVKKAPPVRSFPETYLLRIKAQ